MQTSTLCFGGSFNPIHIGHLRCVRAVALGEGFSQAVLIPSARPPHKREDLASPEDRLAMCRLAIEEEPLLTVDDLELRRTGLSYTIDTVREYRRRGVEDVAWLIGADTVPHLPTWHEPLALLAEVRFVVMERPGSEIDWSAIPEPYRSLEKNVVPAPLVDVSASTIRERVRNGLSLGGWVPPKVAEYIYEHELYQPPAQTN